jgi:hypothetical protein
MPALFPRAPGRARKKTGRRRLLPVTKKGAVARALAFPAIRRPQTASPGMCLV